MKEHAELIGPLQNWLRDEPKVKVVIIGDENLAKKIDMQNQIEYHPLLPYTEYRKVLRKCNIALLPLEKGEPERCKTVIKWAEAAAESVAVVAGPELYTSIAKNSRGETTCCVGSDINEIIMKARALSINKEVKVAQVRAAHEWVLQDWNLDRSLQNRINIYNYLWERRQKLDALMHKRLIKSTTVIENTILNMRKNSDDWHLEGGICKLPDNYWKQQKPIKRH